ncbi:chemotaxis protein CheW [Myxococcus sp. K38C18041901]|uniref:chemotaxis protein CheW n=1 Tax=Myxococcus guangdongensis TaxID=2906760 RepID=UPI0020A7A59E|nr:chemotaxis protein CheW [Myxococcus guangdongensis]MCP3057205.1 chemotaxis protein CheW [Myxococcus guangdongensis]
MSPPSKALAEFVAEATEILEALGKDLLVLDERRGHEADPERVNGIFRAAHSLKGLAGLFGQERISRLAHGTEDLLDRLRLGKLLLDDAVLDTLIEALDAFQALLAETARGSETEGLSRRVEGMAERLIRLGEAPIALDEDPLERLELEAQVRSVFTEYEEHRLRENVRRGVALWRVRAAFDLSDFDKGLADLNTRLKPLGEVISTLPSARPGGAHGIAFDLIFGTHVSVMELESGLSGTPAELAPLNVRPVGVPATAHSAEVLARVVETPAIVVEPPGTRPEVSTVAPPTTKRGGKKRGAKGTAEGRQPSLPLTEQGPGVAPGGAGREDVGTSPMGQGGGNSSAQVPGMHPMEHGAEGVNPSGQIPGTFPLGPGAGGAASAHLSGASTMGPGAGGVNPSSAPPTGAIPPGLIPPSDPGLPAGTRGPGAPSAGWSATVANSGVFPSGLRSSPVMGPGGVALPQGGSGSTGPSLVTYLQGPGGRAPVRAVSTSAEAPASTPPPTVAAAAPEPSLRSLTQTVRVDIGKLDGLINMVGELLLIKANLQRLAESARQDGVVPLSKLFGQELARETRGLERKLEALQEGLLEARMVPVGQVFDKLARLVRRITREAGKEIDFVIGGGEVELDKLIVEELSDPLMHLIRNAIDHGVESPDARLAAGKSRRAVVALRAVQKGNHVVIEVSDDGAGIDELRVREVALTRGLITFAQAEEMGRRELLNLIFLPGFSTARSVSELSGRGVGLDVVKNNLGNLSGIIDVWSERGKGTAFHLTLPVTLAIIRALVVGVSARTYAVPLNSVLEILSVQPREIRTVERREVLDLRGQTLPFVRLSRLFGLPERPVSRYFVVVVGLAQERLGIAVDELHGQQDIVTKPLGGRLQSVRGISGATDLGNRTPVLVLDVGALLEDGLAMERRRA